MKMNDKDIAQQELFKSIIADFHCPEIDSNGNAYWVRDWLLTDNFFKKMVVEETLCNALKRSEGEIFQLDKNLHETVVRKEYPAAKLFYEWISFLFPLVPAKYELPEYSQVVASVANRIGITNALFEVHDPRVILTADGLRQGELVNSFGRRVYERLANKGYREFVKTQNCEMSSAVTKTERYFDRQSRNCRSLGILRMELHYRSGEQAVDMSFVRTAKHLDDFVDALNANDTTGGHLGYWWKRRYMQKCGYGHHFIRLFDASKTASWAVVHNMQETWTKVTQGQGVALEPTQSPDNHRSWGTGSVNNWLGASPLEDVMKSVRMMLMSERYLRLPTHPQYKHYGMGDLPPVVQREDTWTSPPTTMPII